MGSHPLNLALAFLLELVGLFAYGYWGWTQHDGLLRWVLAIGVPVVAAAMWGIFRVPNAPHKAPVQVPGPVRFLLELTYYALAALLWAAANQTTAAAIFAGVVAFHYLISYDRVRWLLKQ